LNRKRAKEGGGRGRNSIAISEHKGRAIGANQTIRGKQNGVVKGPETLTVKKEASLRREYKEGPIPASERKEYRKGRYNLKKKRV